MLTTYLTLIGGLCLLVAGGDSFVRGASGLSLRFGISPLVVGLTVVALGTSLPELTVSVQAALAGSGSIALGNVVGSNIANIALILGVAAMVKPMAAELRVTRFDIPIVIAGTCLFLFLWRDGELSRVESGLLVVLLIVFVVGQLWQGKLSGPAEQVELGSAARPESGSLGVEILFLVLGLVAIVAGGSWTVEGAVAIAQSLGISEGVIGLTLIAVGTSLPELVTSVIAAIKGHGSLALGNAFGSNIFNMFGIAGVTGVIRPLTIGSVEWLDLWVMLAFAVVILPLARSDASVSRREAGLLLVAYAAYLAIKLG